MRNISAVFALSVFILLGVPSQVLGKRAAPPSVAPLTVRSVRYSAPPGPNFMGVIVATEAASGKELWRKRVCRVFLNPFLERDVQWVFIRSLTRRGDALLIENEKGRCYTLDLKSRKVSKLSWSGGGRITDGPRMDRK